MRGEIMMPGVVALLLFLSNDVISAPQFDSYGKTALLYEGAVASETLSTLVCSDTDGDPTTVYVDSVSPGNPCGICFRAFVCGADECLEYRAGVGTLSYSSAQSYIIEAFCDDGNEQEASAIIQVYIQPNSPPYYTLTGLFVKTSVNANGSPAGTLIYEASAIDEESNDLTYSMTVYPASSSSNYEINPATGEITSTIDMRSECRCSVSFEIMVDDGVNTVGPLVVDVEINNPNIAPVGVNMDTTVMVREDATGTAYSLQWQDGNGDALTITTKDNNAAGFAQFTFNGDNLDIVAALNYEDAPLRQTDLVIQASDGFCTSPEYTLRVEVADVNEPPVITPIDRTVDICEGDFAEEFDPGYTLVDEDLVDTHVWSMDPAVTHDFRVSVNPVTGFLQTTVYYSTNPPENFQNRFVYVVNAVDKAKRTATVTVTANFLDCNDNAPYFENPVYTAVATECTPAGTVLLTVVAKDDDTAREQNNVLYYEGSGGSVYAGTNGQIIVDSPMPAGTVVTFNVHARDQGQTPGPLWSENVAVVSVRFTPCPTPAPPVTAAPVTPAPAVPSTAAAATVTQKDENNIWWIVLAALLGLLLLALLSYMLWRYCNLCVHACRKLSCKRCCKIRFKSSKQPKRSKQTPAQPRRDPALRPPQTPPTPEEKDPVGPGVNYLFWTEHYNQKNLDMPTDKKKLPEPDDMKVYNPIVVEGAEPPPPTPEPEKPKKKCTIF